MAPLDDARAALIRKCDAETFSGKIHAVSFQPTPTRANEDRYVVQEWDDVFGSSPWLFLAVLDASSAGDYSPDEISKLLRFQIELFDCEIGEAVKRILPRPEELQALEDFDLQNLVQKIMSVPDNVHVCRRANAGTTLAAALIDRNNKHLWAIGLVLLNAGLDGSYYGETLLTLHNTFTPSEYARIKLSHPTSEQNIMENNRVLGVLSVTRALGDFSFKLHPAYSKVFAKIPSSNGNLLVPDVTHDNHSPPYITATSEVRHIDISSLPRRTSVILHTDGVNNIIEGRYLFRKEDPCTADTAVVLGSLLSVPINQGALGDVFDYAVEPGWNDDNRAVEILGNLLGGRDATRLTQVLTPDLLSMTGESGLYVDDTTIVVCPSFGM
ncbi:hypothetical protein DXG03_004309 [Asterophora parasitica]|uniref:PPM-type phosphatase domain-containing protein n=1 Tax=Asterophora parasitica TaxID=117018 RepID=A0A9P7G6S2_9AGAR|nr:hypothetical protein DXG03_004309 [Asterophora parasitica]